MTPGFEEQLWKFIHRHPDELVRLVELSTLEAKAIAVSPGSEKTIRVFVQAFWSENKQRADMGCAGLDIAIKMWLMAGDGRTALDRLLMASSDSAFWNIVGNYRIYMPILARKM